MGIRKNYNSMIKKILIILLLNIISKVNAQKQEIFGPTGTVWYYENDGTDTSVRLIKIQRDSSIYGLAGFDCAIDSTGGRLLKISYLRSDSSIKSSFHVMYITVHRFVYFYSPKASCKVVLYDFDTITNIVYGTSPLNDIFGQFPNYKNFYSSPMDSITINGKKLAMIGESKDNAYKNDKCIMFCTPFIERIGSLGYMFPINVCYNEAIYAGRLISYYDPEFGYWKVPDSLRNMVCSYKYVNASVNDPFSIKSGFKVYPNPAVKTINIEAYYPNSAMDYCFYNSAGQRLLLGKMRDNTCCTRIELGAFPPGMYFLRLRSGDTWQSEKIVIEK